MKTLPDTAGMTADDTKLLIRGTFKELRRPLTLIVAAICVASAVSIDAFARASKAAPSSADLAELDQMKTDAIREISVACAKKRGKDYQMQFACKNSEAPAAELFFRTMKDRSI
jgi:hypothetical protein